MIHAAFTAAYAIVMWVALQLVDGVNASQWWEHAIIVGAFLFPLWVIVAILIRARTQSSLAR